MRKIIIKPLEKEYITIIMHATDLEEPFPFKNTKLQEERSFEFGDITHTVILNMLFSKDKWKYAYAFYSTDMDADQKKLIMNWVSKSSSLPELLLIEQKKRVVIEFWKYMIILASKLDGIYINWEEMTIVDVKTSKYKWDINEAEWKMQMKVYAFVHQIPNIEWWIYTKVNPELQRMNFTLDIENNKQEVLNKIINHMEVKYGYNPLQFKQSEYEDSSKNTN